MTALGTMLSACGAGLAWMVMRGPGVRVPAIPFVQRRRERRAAAAVVEALPDALRRLAAELGAGRTLERALASTGLGVPGSLGEALRQLGARIARGQPIDEAVAEVLPVHEATGLLAAGLALHRRTGGDLPRLCRELARTLDERRRVEAEVGALTAQARFSARVVPLLPPVGLAGIALLDPSAVDALLGTPLGLAIVAVAATMDLVGALVVRRLAAGIA